MGLSNIKFNFTFSFPASEFEHLINLLDIWIFSSTIATSPWYSKSFYHLVRDSFLL